MDIHRSFAQVAILEDGAITRQLRVELVHEPLVAFAKTLCQQALNTGSSAFRVARNARSGRGEGALA